MFCVCVYFVVIYFVVINFVVINFVAIYFVVIYCYFNDVFPLSAAGTSTISRPRAAQRSTSLTCGRRCIVKTRLSRTSWTSCASWAVWTLLPCWRRTRVHGYEAECVSRAKLLTDTWNKLLTWVQVWFGDLETHVWVEWCSCITIIRGVSLVSLICSQNTRRLWHDCSSVVMEPRST